MFQRVEYNGHIAEIRNGNERSKMLILNPNMPSVEQIKVKQLIHSKIETVYLLFALTLITRFFYSLI